MKLKVSSQWRGALCPRIGGLVIRMSETLPPSITQLLVAWGKGDQQTFNALMPEVEKELHRNFRSADEVAGRTGTRAADWAVSHFLRPVN